VYVIIEPNIKKNHENEHSNHICFIKVLGNLLAFFGLGNGGCALQINREKEQRATHQSAIFYKHILPY
jgi:hypothetical protein